MNEYLLSIIGTVLLSSFVIAVLPDGKMSDIIKATAKMICLLVIIAPIPIYLKRGQSDKKNENLHGIFSSTVIQTDGRFIQYYSELRLRETAQALEKEILDVFSCETEVALVCESIIEPSDYEYLKVASIQVSLQDEASDTQKERIKAYLMEAYGSEVYIE